MKALRNWEFKLAVAAGYMATVNYGHICRLMPGHLNVMHTQMEVLKCNNYTDWQEIPEVNGYARALRGVNPAGDVEKGGIEMFDRLPKLFLHSDEAWRGK